MVRNGRLFVLIGEISRSGEVRTSIIWRLPRRWHRTWNKIYFFSWSVSEELGNVISNYQLQKISSVVDAHIFLVCLTIWGALDLDLMGTSNICSHILLQLSLWIHISTCLHIICNRECGSVQPRSLLV